MILAGTAQNSKMGDAKTSRVMDSIVSKGFPIINYTFPTVYGIVLDR